MPRPEKIRAVEEIKAQLENSEAVFLTEYRGLSVSQQQELRRGLREAEAEYKVLKMSLARRAAHALGLDELEEWLAGPTAIAFTRGDPVLTARTLRNFARDNEQLVLKAGLLAGRVIPPEQVTVLADIEPREVLLSKIAGAAKAPLSNLAGAFAALMRDAASMFSQLLEAIELPGEAAPPGEEPGPRTQDEVTGEAEAPDEEPEAGEPSDATAEDEPTDEVDAAGTATEDSEPEPEEKEE
jgi:large subunit ribosomal protein L10